MRILSEIGTPLYRHVMEKFDWGKGDSYRGFVFPYNVIGSLKVVFDRFQLWENGNGICVPGVNYTTLAVEESEQFFSRTKYTIQNLKPIFVGDTVNDEPVIHCENVFLHERRQYRCYMEFGELPEPVIPPEDPKLLYLKNLYDLLQGMITSTCNAFDNYTTEILKPITVIVPGGVVTGTCPAGAVAGTTAPITSNPVSIPGSVESIKTKLKNEVEEMFKKVLESEWH